MADPSPNPALLEQLKAWASSFGLPISAAIGLYGLNKSPIGAWLKRFWDADNRAEIARQVREDRVSRDNQSNLDRMQRDIERKDRELEDLRNDLREKEAELDRERQRTVLERERGNTAYAIAWAWYSYFLDRRVAVLEAFRIVNSRLKATGDPGLDFQPEPIPPFDRIVEVRGTQQPRLPPNLGTT